MSYLGQVNKDFALCVLCETSSTLDILLSMLKTHHYAKMLFDLLSVDNTLK